VIAFSRPLPVRYAITIAAAWEPTARTIETIRETRYGLRKPSRRKNVWRYGTVVATVGKSSFRYLLGGLVRGQTGGMGSDFPREDAFDEDYLYFYEELLTPERTAAEVELVWKLLELEPGLELLDLACGHGRIANALAERRVRVTGLDATPLFLKLALADAAERGVEVEYVEGDMRSLPWTDRFDRVLCWFTSFGYFSDEENRQVLEEAHRALEPGGLLAIEMNNLLRLIQVYADEVVTERGDDKMIDRHRFDIQTSRSLDERTIIRGGKRRSFEFSVRMFTPAELRSWMLDAGFREAIAYGDDGERLTPEHEGRRMTVVGRK
jgi:ubiquinone/menaquinone biosynthesis C-methylase UbiE